MTKQADLIAYVFDGRPHRFSAELKRWMEGSPRFTAFVDSYQDKIRKKVRVTQERESSLDLRCELEVAWRLLSDRRLEVAYEPYASKKGRGPDFTVTYRSNLLFNVEVTRLRTSPGENGRVRPEERMVRTLLGKMGQMQSGMPNLLVMQMEEELARFLDLGNLMHRIKIQADTKDPAFYATIPYSSPAAFYKDFLHLSGVFVWAPSPQVWVNRQARSKLDEKILRLVTSLVPDASPE